MMHRIACYFGGRAYLGGAERRIGRIMNSLAKQGMDISFVFVLYDDFEQVVSAYKKALGDKLYINFKGFNSGMAVFKHMVKEKYDCAVYTGPYKAMMPFFFGAKISGSKKLFLQVSTEPIVGEFHSKLSELEFDFVFNCSDWIDSLNPSGTIRFKQNFPKKRITTTPCPFTQLDVFFPKKKEKSIVFLSRWVKGKGTDLCVDSIISIQDFLHSKGYQVFLCGGQGSEAYTSLILEKVKKCKYNDLFVLPGFVESEEYLPQAEVFLSLQTIDNYPSQSLLEAIACGCYVIASDVGDTKIIVNEKYGALCNLSVESISSEIIKAICRSNEERNASVIQARDFAKKELCIENSIRHYKGLFSELMQ